MHHLILGLQRFKIIRVGLHKDIKVSDLQANTKLALKTEYQIKISEVPSSMPIWSNILLLDFFCFLCSKASDANIAPFVLCVKTPNTFLLGHQLQSLRRLLSFLVLNNLD